MSPDQAAEDIELLRRMLELGVTLAIGTDSASCSDNQNMYEAMRYASMASNVRGPDYHRWLTTPEIIRAATIGGVTRSPKTNEPARTATTGLT